MSTFHIRLYCNSSILAMSLFLSTVDILTAIREELPASLYLSAYTLKLNTYLPPWKTVPFNKASEDPAQMQSNDRSMCNRCATRSHGPRSGWSSVCGRSWKIINTWTEQLHWSLFYSSRSVPMCQKQSWVVSISLTHLCRTPPEQSTVSYPALKDTTGNNIFKSSVRRSLCLDGFSLSPFSQSTLLKTFSENLRYILPKRG